MFVKKVMQMPASAVEHMRQSPAWAGLESTHERPAGAARRLRPIA